MPVELEMPELAESVIEGEIVKWLVKEGEHVHLDQPLVEVMTDKVTVEVPSPYEGTLLKQVAKEGEVVPIGKPIAIFGKEGEKLDSGVPLEHVTPKVEVKETVEQARPPQEQAQVEQAQVDHGQAEQAQVDQGRPLQEKVQGNGQVGQAETAPGPGSRPLAAPAVRKLARQLGVDLARVRGSGDGGRIRKEDVEQAATGGTVEQVDQGRPLQQKVEQARPLQPRGTPGERVPLRGMRRAIADHMVHSKRTAAHTLHVDEVDLTELVALRESAKKAAAERGIKLTYLPFIVKSVCAALKTFPYMNASLDDEKHEIVLKKDYNIGIATNTEGGLVVPVIHNADRLTLVQLAGAIVDLAEKARAGKLSHDEISGGTFTITNVGSVGGLFTFPVINYPEVGILGTHAIVPRPVVRDGQIVVRQMMYLSISFDHRVVDGALAAHFVQEVARLLSSPLLLLMEEI